ncbi:MAG: endonuclease/exonuclease/phosphatase family protein [Chloroflexi bacterium]|nr:endonuclease/exonuclease/phosphatase family protein [Chloroflexota bacterium]
MHTDTNFSLLTFNCFGGLSWTTPRRLRTLSQELDHSAAQIVCLQEVQTYAAQNLLTRTCLSHPQQAFIPGMRAPRGSLLTLARDQPITTHFTRYETQGPWHGPTIMDRITQKGALVTEFQYGGIPIHVVNTHLVANYGGNWRPDNRVAKDQQRQLQQLATLVRAQPPEALVLVAGDFNLPRGCWLYDEFLERSGLTDPLVGDARPTYRPFPGVPARYALPIDFIFVRSPAALPVKVATEFQFTEKLPFVGGGRGYLSDHMALLVTLRWQGTHAG